MDEQELLKKVTKYRRDLHRHPETELDTIWTQNYLKNILKDLDCQIIEPCGYALAAFFDAGKEKSIVFRSDMDALPVNEECSHDYVSQIPGKMHACGHDGHMAMLAGFALVLNEMYRELNVNVLLLFQPGEESPGGAERIVQTGLFETYRAAAVYGTHLWPTLPKGCFATRPQELMAMASEVNVVITGKSVHAGRWQTGIDAMEAGARYLLKIYAAADALPEEVRRVIRFGRMEAGTVRNALAGQARLEGTLRAFDEEVYWFLRNTMETEACRMQRETGCAFALSFSNGYPPVINDPVLTARAKEILPDLEILDEPVMISEDFSWYQKKVPGVFFYLGTGTGIELHSGWFDFEEDLLLKGIENYTALIRAY